MQTAFFLVVISSLAVAQHPSPCPDIFKYTEGGPGRWVGEMTLNSEFPLDGVWVRVQVDRKVEKLESTFGTTAQREEKSFLIKSRDYNLVPGSPLIIPIAVTYFSEDPAPSVTSIRLNARTVCPAVSSATTNNVPVRECLGVYTIDKEEENRWHGSITLNSEFQLDGIWLRIVLDRPAELFVNKFGDTHTSDNLSYLISNRNYTLAPEDSLRVQFWVKYDSDTPKPTIQTVRINARTMCDQIVSEDNN